jgi:hypothetical protein
MPHKNPNADRFGGPGSSRQDSYHPEKGGRQHHRRAVAFKVSGGGGERDQHHTHDDRHRS